MGNAGTVLKRNHCYNEFTYGTRHNVSVKLNLLCFFNVIIVFDKHLKAKANLSIHNKAAIRGKREFSEREIV